jgi:hypothetical protein
MQMPFGTRVEADKFYGIDKALPGIELEVPCYAARDWRKGVDSQDVKHSLE